MEKKFTDSNTFEYLTREPVVGVGDTAGSYWLWQSPTIVKSFCRQFGIQDQGLGIPLFEAPT